MCSRLFAANPIFLALIQEHKSPSPTHSLPLEIPTYSSPACLVPSPPYRLALLRPPPHPPITLHNLPHLLHPQPPLLHLPPQHLPRPPPVKTQIAIPQQLLLHKRTQRARIAHPLLLEQFRPRLQHFFIHIIDHAVEVEPRELAYQRALEAGGDVEDGAEDRGECALGSIAAVDDVEGTVGFRVVGGRGAPLGRGPGGRADVLDVDGVDAEVFAPEPFHFLALSLIDAGET